MFYVSSRNDKGLFGVTDTKDNIEEFYTKDDLLQIVSTSMFCIDGVDI